MFWITFLIVLIFTAAGWLLFKDSESIGWRLLLTLSASGLAFWIMAVAIAACKFSGCVVK